MANKRIERTKRRGHVCRYGAQRNSGQVQRLIRRLLFWRYSYAVVLNNNVGIRVL